MNTTRTVMKGRPGVAMLIVLMIGLLAFVAVTGLLGYLVPRQRTVSGEALSDRSLALADGFIDQLLTNVNAQGELTKSSLQSGSGSVEDAVIKSLLANLNGGNPDTDTLNVIRKNVRSYVFDTSTSTYYRIDGGAFTKSILTSGVLTSLDGATSFGTIASMDSLFATDNRWFQIDTNCDYDYAPSTSKNDIWGLRVSAFNISRPELRRTVQADAGRGEITVEPNWYSRVVGPNGEKSFCEYAGVYNNGAAYGQYEVITGPIRSNGTINMGGWARDRVYAHNQVTDGSGDTGRFGPLKWNLNNSQIGKYVFPGYPTAVWDNGALTLWGTKQFTRDVVGDTGIQDKCSATYYVNGDAHVEFSNPGGTGKVTINGVLLDMPPDGLIFVEGNAWVKGTVHGRVTLGCRGTINIWDDVVYSIPPRVNSADAMPALPDALGLVAGQQVFIPKLTYDANHTLTLDAAIFSVTGGLQIDPTVVLHNENTTPHYEAFWNGAQALNDASKTPLTGSGSSTRGYELQHTQLDWNLKDYGAPPMFPGTGTTAIPGEVDWVLLKTPDDSGILTQLNGVTPIALSTSDPAYDPAFAKYYYVVSGKTYYTAGSTGTMYAKYSPDQTALSRYRVSWKEQIATPVRQP